MGKRLRKIKEMIFENIDGKKMIIYLIIMSLIYALGICFIGEALRSMIQSTSENFINPGITAFSMLLSHTFALGIIVYCIFYKFKQNEDVKLQKEIDEINRFSHMKDLEDKYENFIKLLNDELREIFGNIDESEVSHEFLEKLEDYENKYNSVLPQSFTEATCMFLALIHCPIIKANSENEDEKKEILSLNVRIALGCAIKMIMHPFTVYMNLNGKVCKEYYDKVVMLFPDGNSLDCEEGQKLMNSIYDDIIKYNGTQGFKYYEMLFRRIYMYGRKR